MTAKPRSEKFERGLKTRRSVLGAEYVDRSLEQADDGEDREPALVHARYRPGAGSAADCVPRRRSIWSSGR